ncbi:MAG: hypothetical protein E4H09_01150 [Spirochaetales bacterium]|nr:MAG: hypothetical protein E4H09_01150 [Spirochaetales bacterium]
MSLTHKDRYIRLFRGEPVDRAPFYLIMGPSAQALDRWVTEGLDVDLDTTDPASYARAATIEMSAWVASLTLSTGCSL